MPKPSSVRSIRLPDDVWARVAERSATAGLSINAYVAKAIEDAMLDRPKRERQVADVEPFRAVGEKAAAALMPLLHRPAFNPQPKKGKK